MPETVCLARNKTGGIQMHQPWKVLSVFGTRPEAIKMAPLVKELERRDEQFISVVAVTAQHREMLDQVLDMFAITPQYDLNMMKQNQTLADITTAALQGLETVLLEEKPDMVLVHGDTSTTFAASLIAFYHRIPVGHVEAGLRTWNKYSPYPEEMNRQLTAVLADLHFAPTEKARTHLLEEGKQDASIVVTGNTVIDSMQTTVDEAYTHPLLENFPEHRLVLVTAHRRENLGEKLTDIFMAIRELVDTNKDIHVVYPVHLNPKIKALATDILGHHERIALISPLNVRDFHNFMAKSHIILTDSGGIQEEAPSLGVPVLVLRDTTERPEGIEAGTLQLAGTDRKQIVQMADKLLNDTTSYLQMAQAKNPYGDGRASKRIADTIVHYLEENK